MRLGNQVFTNHVYQRIPLDIFRVAPRLQALIKVRGAVQLRNAFGDCVGVFLLSFRVFEKFFRDRLRMDSGSHVVMTFVAQNANQFGSQSLIQDLHCRFAICLVTFSDFAAFDVLTGTTPSFFNIS